MAAHIEKVFAVRVGAAADGTALIACDGKDDAKMMLEFPRQQAQELTLQLIQAGYGPSKVGHA